MNNITCTDYAALADIARAKELSDHLDPPLTPAQELALCAVEQSLHGCWPTPDMLYAWEEIQAGWCDYD